MTTRVLLYGPNVKALRPIWCTLLHLNLVVQEVISDDPLKACLCISTAEQAVHTSQPGHWPQKQTLYSVLTAIYWILSFDVQWRLIYREPLWFWTKLSKFVHVVSWTQFFPWGDHFRLPDTGIVYCGVVGILCSREIYSASIHDFRFLVV